MIKKILKNQFFKVLSYNSIIILGKVITSFVVSKVSAIYLGPSGFALVGNFKNLFQGVLGITSSGFESGVIRHIAESKNKKEEYASIISTVFALSTLIALFIAPFIYIFSETLSISILKENSYAFVFKYFAFLLPIISFNFLLFFIINGLQRFKLFTQVSILLNVLNAVLTFVLIHFYNLKGALIVSLLVPVLCLAISFFLKETREIIYYQLFSLKNVSIKIIKSLSVYVSMAIYSAVLISITYLLLRNSIIKNVDIETAGLWEAMNKISTFYMIFFSSLFTLYLLPKLSLNKTINGYNTIMFDYFKFIIPLMITLFVVCYILRIFIIKLFLTDDFLEIKDFFYLQMIGDFLRVIAFSFAYQFHAKKMVASYFISDAILYITFYMLSIYLLNDFNIQGVYYAYIVSALLYLISVSLFVFFNRNKYLKKNV